MRTHRCICRKSSLKALQTAPPGTLCMVRCVVFLLVDRRAVWRALQYDRYPPPRNFLTSPLLHHVSSLSPLLCSHIPPPAGGMQDWNYVWPRVFAITLEVSEVKWPEGWELPSFWDANRLAMLQYACTCVCTCVCIRIVARCSSLMRCC